MIVKIDTVVCYVCGETLSVKEPGMIPLHTDRTRFYCQGGGHVFPHSGHNDETARLVGSYITPKGYETAPANDPALAGLEPGDTAWYAPSGHVVVLRFTEKSALLDWYDVDGNRYTPAAIPLAAATPEILAGLIVAVAR